MTDPPEPVRQSMWSRESASHQREELQHVITLVMDFADATGRRITPQELAQQLGLTATPHA